MPGDKFVFMEKILIVRAHPLTGKSASNSMRLADAFVETYRQTNPKDHITELALYDVAIPEIDLDLLNGWKQLGEGVPFVHLHSAEQNKVTLFDHYTDQFLDANKIVVANPLWNLQVPTRLKAWIDTISVAGKTFRYTDSGEAEGLVKGKKAAHLQSAGAVFNFQDPASIYMKTMLNFLGITDFHQIAAEGMDHDPQNAEAIMDAAVEEVRELAAEF